MARHHSRSLLAIVVACTLTARASAHGYLTYPPARQVIKGLGVTPVENGNSLGLGSITTTFKPPREGICGDPFEGSFNGLYPVSTMAYDNHWAVHVMDGDALNITLTLAANHTGSHTFHIAPVLALYGQPPLALYGQGSGSDSALAATGLPSGANMPLEGDTQWWTRSPADPLVPWETYTAQFRLPAGIVGEDNAPVRAVLRWEWKVRKDCTLLCGGVPANSTEPCGPFPLITPQNCDGLPDPIYIFSNCADVLITPLPFVNSGTDTGAPNPPPYPPAPSPPPWPIAYQQSDQQEPPPPDIESCVADLDAFCAYKGMGTGLFPDPCSCKQFISCESGYTGAFGQVHVCSEGRRFNVNTLQCDGVSNATCGNGLRRSALKSLNLWKF